jgi:hypothetical protein
MKKPKDETPEEKKLRLMEKATKKKSTKIRKLAIKTKLLIVETSNENS